MDPRQIKELLQLLKDDPAQVKQPISYILNFVLLSILVLILAQVSEMFGGAPLDVVTKELMVT